MLRYDTSAAGTTLNATHEWNLTSDLPTVGSTNLGLEANGRIYAYALNHSNSSYVRVATIASGESKIMDLSFDRSADGLFGTLWAYCDNGCGNKSRLLGIDTTVGSATFGKFIIRRAYNPPSSLPNVNNEGIAMAPESECADNLKTFLWADDSETSGHAIRRGTIACGILF